MVNGSAWARGATESAAKTAIKTAIVKTRFFMASSLIASQTNH
jgi:hypothetical protein